MWSCNVLVLSLTFFAFFHSFVQGHGWLNQPCPRSTSSPTTAPGVCATSTGTASTTSPCGKGLVAPTKIPFAATFTRGQYNSVVYQRANSHGVTASDVTFTLVSGSTMPAPAGSTVVTLVNLTGASLLPMNVGLATPQPPQMLMVPTTFPTGPATLQFSWKPTSGGDWFDCADVTIVDAAAASPCAAGVNPCSDVCTVSSSNTAVCSCFSGNQFALGSSSKCVPLPPPAHILITVHGDTLLAVNGVSGQDVFDTALTSAFPNFIGLFNFDVATYNSTTNSSTVSAFVSALNLTFTGQFACNALIRFFNDPNLVASFAKLYPPVSLVIDNNAAILAPVSGATNPPNNGVQTQPPLPTSLSSSPAASSSSSPSSSPSSSAPSAKPTRANAAMKLTPSIYLCSLIIGCLAIFA